MTGNRPARTAARPALRGAVGSAPRGRIGGA